MLPKQSFTPDEPLRRSPSFLRRYGGHRTRRVGRSSCVLEGVVVLVLRRLVVEVVEKEERLMLRNRYWRLRKA